MCPQRAGTLLLTHTYNKYNLRANKPKMKFCVSSPGCFQVLFYCLVINTLSLVTSQTQTSSGEKDMPKCELIETDSCSKLYSSAHLPNLYGHMSAKLAEEKVKELLSNFSEESSAVIAYICSLYLPPCSDNRSNIADLRDRNFRIAPLPCRPLCELAAEEGRRLFINKEQTWPIKCQTLPTENCFSFLNPTGVVFVKRSISVAPSKISHNDIASFATLDVELGNDDGYEVEVVSMSNNQIPERRYDIANLGDPNFFQGWTDVQGTGAANDYCRVIGKGKRRFLSCNLAGSTGQGHHYVSKLGFEAGHPNTWFMRDMDGDNRDDYCRCVGPKNNSKITCMKAGENGFYGSTTQGGNQHTFIVPGSERCHSKRYNPMFGERVV